MIDWSKAPEWARWIARDANGKWWWHSQRPVVMNGEWQPKFISEWVDIERADIRCNKHWLLSLTKRGNLPSPAELNTMDCKGGQ